MMEGVCGGPKHVLGTEHLEAEHLRIKDRAMLHFRSKRKMGGDEFSERYKDRLEEVVVWALFDFLFE
jgi:atlastin